MGSLDGRVVIVTGVEARRRRVVQVKVARLLAREGASVVVNDLGGALDGKGAEQRGPRGRSPTRSPPPAAPLWPTVPTYPITRPPRA